MDNSLIFIIRIGDVNDHAPQFAEKEFNVSVRASHKAGVCTGPGCPSTLSPPGSPARQCGATLPGCLQGGSSLPWSERTRGSAARFVFGKTTMWSRVCWKS